MRINGRSKKLEFVEELKMVVDFDRPKYLHNCYYNIIMYFFVLWRYSLGVKENKYIVFSDIGKWTRRSAFGKSLVFSD